MQMYTKIGLSFFTANIFVVYKNIGKLVYTLLKGKGFP